MRKLFHAALLALAIVLGSLTAASAAPPEIPQQVVDLVNSLKPQQGKVTLEEARATLDLGDKYDFYTPQDARTILVDLWGNPPGATEGVLGLVMPAGVSPLSESWGAVVTFEEVGHVSDDDAADVDYAEILATMKEDNVAANSERRAAGYPTVDIKGWAETPVYDPATHSVVWAQDLLFADSPVHTLNYDLRTLGRRGVLSVNFVSTMPHIDAIRVAANDFANHASFEPGARYEDFNPATDAKAEYGIGGLVAAGVGLAAAKKLGILAILAKFSKLIFIGIGLAAAAAWKFLAGRKEAQDDDFYTYEDDLAASEAREADTPPEFTEAGEAREGRPPA